MKSHSFCAASSLLFPGEKQFGISLRQIIGGSNSQRTRGRVYPARRPFDFSKIADGRVVNYNVAFAIVPLRTEFFVTEYRRKSQSEDDGFHLRAISHLRFRFHAYFVPSRLP